MSEYWTQTYSGVAFDLLEPKASMVRPQDIAHSLAKQDRYNGHGRIFYPVAQHSLLVGALLKMWGCTEEEIREGKLHDAIEAYIGDLISPMKRAMRAVLAARLANSTAVYPDTLVPAGTFSALAKEFDPFAGVEAGIELVVRERLDMLPVQPRIVTKADLVVLANERDRIMAPCAQDWNLPYPKDPGLDQDVFFEEGAWRYWRDFFAKDALGFIWVDR